MKLRIIFQEENQGLSQQLAHGVYVMTSINTRSIENTLGFVHAAHGPVFAKGTFASLKTNTLLLLVKPRSFLIFVALGKYFVSNYPVELPTSLNERE